jgi:Cdc6-like AAA superfamily ATPase
MPSAVTYKKINFFKKLVLTLLGSCISVLLIFPLVSKLKIISNFFQSNRLELFAGITSLILFIFILTWEKMHRFCKRYKEEKEKKKGNFPLLFVDLLVLYIAFSAILSSLKIILNPRESNDRSTGFIIFVIINGVFCLVWFFWSYRKKAPVENNTNPKDDFSDDPINSSDPDLLRRGKFIKDLFNGITNLQGNLANSFTIGLNGSWGEGKTSVINLLIDKMKSRDDFLVIRFDPWYFSDENAILNAFYEQLENEFARELDILGIKRSISRYVKAISTGVSLPWGKFDLNLFEHSVEQIKKRIEDYIEQMGKRVLIIIDDIDRLQPNEIALVFKLVRMNSNFKNTIFLMCFDQQVVKKSLKTLANVEKDFLDKIINKPIPLPAIEQENIDQFLLSKVADLLEKLEIPQEKEERQSHFQGFRIIYKLQINALFQTLRIAKRYINSLNFTLPSLKFEVNPYDFLLLEIIRMFSPEIYTDIWENPHYYIKYGKTVQTSKSQSLIRYNNNSDADIKNHVEHLLLKQNSNGQIIKELLVELFPKVIGGTFSTSPSDFKASKEGRKWKWIKDGECFMKYFLFLVPENQTSDEEIETMIDEWKSKPPDEQEELIQEKLFSKGVRPLVEKLSIFIEKIDSQIALSLVDVISMNADKFSFADFLGSEMFYVVKRMLELIEVKIDKNRIIDALEVVAMSSTDPFFPVLTMRLLIHPSNYPGIDAEHRESFGDKIYRRLKEYLGDNKIDIFEINEEKKWSFILYQKEFSPRKTGIDIQRLVSLSIYRMVRKDVRKFIKFLRSIETIDIDKFMASQMAGNKKIQKDFHDIYDYEKFRKVALKFKDDDSLSDEEKALIEKFMEKPSQTPLMPDDGSINTFPIKT